jgi:uncharacterized protein (TIGR02145 family)
MKYIIKLSLLFSILFFLTTCEKEVEEPHEVKRVQETQGGKYETQTNVIQISSSEILSLETVDSVLINDKKIPVLEISVSVDKAAQIKPGAVLISDNSNTPPYLVLEQLQSNKSAGATNSLFNFKVVQSPLDLVFPDGVHLKFNTKENRSKKNAGIQGKIYGLDNDRVENESEIWEEGKVVNLTGYSSSFLDEGLTVNYNNSFFLGNKYSTKDGSGYSAKGGIALNGSLKINPSFDFEMIYGEPHYCLVKDPVFEKFLKPFKVVADVFPVTMKKSELQYFRGIMYLDLDYELSFEINAEGKLQGNIIKIPVTKIKAAYPIGPAWVTHKTELYFKLDVSMAAAGKKTFYVKQENDIVRGVEIKRENAILQPATFFQYSEKRNFDGSHPLTLEFDLAAGIKLCIEHEHYICSVLGPSIEAGGFFEYNEKNWINTNNEKGWSKTVDLGLYSQATIDLSMFHIDKATWQFYGSDEYELDWNLYTSPYKVECTEGNNQSAIAGSALGNPVKVRVLDSNNQPVADPVRVYFGGQDVSGFHGAANPASARTQNNLASTVWTLGSQLGSQKLLAYLKSPTGEKTGVAAEINATAVQSPPPVADFIASKTTVAKGETIQFTDKSTNNPTSWLWDFGDGSAKSTQQNPTKSYQTAGTYTVTLQASNAFGSNSKSLTISVSDGPVINYGQLTDPRDNKTYKTVIIGEQEWMAENLAYLPSVSPRSQYSFSVPLYYIYGYQGTSVSEAKANDNYNIYGVLYNFPAALQSCPAGWHLPSDAEWKHLEMTLGMTQSQADSYDWRGTNQGSQLKATSINGTNTSGFSALPGGRYVWVAQYFNRYGDGYWWCSTMDGDSFAWSRSLAAYSDKVERISPGRGFGLSVRCLRD